MTIRQAATFLDAKVLCCEDQLDTEISCACGSDMMSDVLAFVKEHALLLTGLVNPQVIRTAEMMDMRGVIFVRGKTPTPVIVDLAREKNIVVMKTDYRMFSACGILYDNGLRPENDRV